MNYKKARNEAADVCMYHVHCVNFPLYLSTSNVYFTGLPEPGWLNNGKESKFSLISGLAVKHDGYTLFISDSYNSAIREFFPPYNKMVDFLVGAAQTGIRSMKDLSFHNLIA